MRILRLHFMNIHSLKGEFTVDFTKSPLVETGIFAITGPTGSGKSTLLDVITLALYNNTPRIGTLSKKTVENYGTVITRNTDECFAEVEYEVKSGKYRSKWSISKARTGSWRDYDMELANLSDNSIISSKKSEVAQKNTEIIGLDYEQFIKSIILSQGEFARFLKSKPDDRDALLEKITGTQKYRDIGKAAFNKHKIEKNKLDTLQQKKETYILLTKDEIDNLENEKKLLNSNIIQFSELLKDFNQQKQFKVQIEHISNNKKILSKKYDQTQADYEKFNAEIERLKKHEKIMKHKSEIIKYKDLSIQNKHLIEKRNQNKNRLKSNETKLIEFKNKLDLQTSKINNRKVEYEKYKPIIKDVNEIDSKIKINKNFLDNIIDEQNKQKIELSSITKEITLLEQSIFVKKNQLNSIRTFLEENKRFTNLKNNISLIKHKFEGLKKQKETISNSTKYKNLSTWRSILTELTNEQNQIHENLNELKQFINYDINKITDLRNEIEILREKHLQINNLEKNAITYLNKKEKSELANDNLTTLESDLKQSDAEKNTLSEQLQIIEKYIIEYKAKFERQQLEAKYADIRSQLKKGEACFLCGSTQHPYVESYKSNFNETKEQLNKFEKKQEKITKDIQKIEHNISKIRTQQKSQNEYIKSLKDELLNLEDEFRKTCNKYDFKLEIETIQEIKNLSTIITNTGKKLKQQILAIEKYNELIDKLSKIEINIDKIRNLGTQYSELNEILLKYIDIKDDSQISLQLITKLNHKVKELEEKEKLFEQLSSDLKTDEQRVEDKIMLKNKYKTKLEKINKGIEKETNNLSELKQKRFKLFGDKNTETFIDFIKNEIDKQQKELSNIEKELERLKTLIENQKQTDIELEEEINIIKRKIDLLYQPINIIFNDFGVKSVDQALNILLSENQIDEIRKKEKEFIENIKAYQEQIKSINQEIFEIDKKNDKTKNLNAILQLINENEKKRNEANRRIGAIETKLAENEKRKKEAKSLIEEINQQIKELKRWEALDYLIGDAQGKKFAGFAQEITMQQLITIANKHLKKLNQRYLIKKSKQALKDNLIVIDTYLANSERSVQTLSGGETFLLSLALALGLADLAGKNTMIDSLFIDEGFGSLDQQSLDIALTALEELQNHTNRTIGIISHVQELKERIPTQIELKKISSGFSTIDIK